MTAILRPRLPARLLLVLTGCALLGACNNGSNSQESEDASQTERIALDELPRTAADPIASPDTKEARWAVSEDGQSIRFGMNGGPPMFSLECKIRQDPTQVTFIRHLPARPGQKALLPIIGNGVIVRLKVDATVDKGAWVWEGTLPSADPQLNVFTGRGEMEATLPGGGTLVIAGSHVPGEFISWCRARGRVQQAAEQEKVAAALEAKETPAPDTAAE
ncbi:hypothetical protein GRI97_09675 [Altererythrobacter xixiisoli]|uniref:Uncharacterized protein n=1 Tax=Croceibacterium xixiisoli TaxID=1476466 RepID=A0A6I4TWT1_9SPHN|nr:hypothetical protein [Croceibacterium xixiisoli]MXO99257.1 hypothetical protein [Croceibacterium xixiisoli]